MDGESGTHGSNGWKRRIPGFGPCCLGDFQVQGGHKGGGQLYPPAPLPPLALAAAVRNLLCRVPGASRQFLLASLASPPLYFSRVFRSSAEPDLGTRPQASEAAGPYAFSHPLTLSSAALSGGSSAQTADGRWAAALLTGSEDQQLSLVFWLSLCFPVS